MMTTSADALKRCLVGMLELAKPSKLGGKMCWDDYAPLLEIVGLLSSVRTVKSMDTAGFGD